jgi:Na+/H+ antiporter NhaA
VVTELEDGAVWVTVAGRVRTGATFTMSMFESELAKSPSVSVRAARAV